MIRIDPAVSSLNTSEYYSTLETFKAAKLLVLSGSDCCYGCSVDLPAMANLSDPTDIYTNDLADFIIKVNTGDVVTGTLIKIDPDGTETDYVITDNTYGRYWATGSLKTNVWGFLLNWYNVANLCFCY